MRTGSGGSRMLILKYSAPPRPDKSFGSTGYEHFVAPGRFPFPEKQISRGTPACTRLPVGGSCASVYATHPRVGFLRLFSSRRLAAESHVLVTVAGHGHCCL